MWRSKWFGFIVQQNARSVGGAYGPHCIERFHSEEVFSPAGTSSNSYRGAQLALARFYCARRANSKDLIQAYKWQLIASEQMSRTSNSVGKTMTMEQLLQAEEMAAEWLKKTQKLPPSSIRDVTDRPPMMGQAGVAD